jgi:spore cortex formation protein SpoVR/YcgB (stage V sporulation)
VRGAIVSGGNKSEDLSEKMISFNDGLEIHKDTEFILKYFGKHPENKKKYYFFIRVKAENLDSLKKEVEEEGVKESLNYGVLVAGGEGEPEPELLNFLKIRYGYDENMSLYIDAD